MSLNTSHASNGVLLYAGEYILVYSNKVSFIFSGNNEKAFNGTKFGRIYLTSHRIIFNNKKASDLLQSFSAPFFTICNVNMEKPEEGNNYLKGTVMAQPNGNFLGQVEFKLYFKCGGVYEFGKALLHATLVTRRNLSHDISNEPPPPYTPAASWYEAPLAAYIPSATGYYGWLPKHEAFQQIPPNTVFMAESLPPFPGIGASPPFIDLYPPPPPPVEKCRWQHIVEPQPQPQSEEPDWNKLATYVPETYTQTNTCAPTGRCLCKSDCQTHQHQH